MLLALKNVNGVFMVGIFYHTAFFRNYTPCIGYQKKASPLDPNSITGCGLFPAAAEDNTRLYKNFTTKFDILSDELLVNVKYTREYKLLALIV